MYVGAAGHAVCHACGLVVRETDENGVLARRVGRRGELGGSPALGCAGVSLARGYVL